MRICTGESVQRQDVWWVRHGAPANGSRTVPLSRLTQPVDGLPGAGIEEERRICWRVKREGIDEAAGHAVEGPAADPTEMPVVLDETDDRGLVGELVVDVVGLSERVDDQHRQTRAVAAQIVRLPTFGRAATVVGYIGRLVDDWTRHVVVPAARVVVGDDARRRPPLRTPLDAVDRRDEEVLLIERVRVAGLAVLVLRRL